MQGDINKVLKDPGAVHFILGMSRLPAGDLKLTVEYYYKEYFDFPVDTLQKQSFFIDELIENCGFLYGHSNLTDKGRAYSCGLEITLHKKCQAVCTL